MPAGTEKVGLADLRVSSSASPNNFAGVPDLPTNRRLSVVNLGASLQNLPPVGAVAPTTAPGEYVDYSQHSEISMRLADSKRPWYKEAVFYELYVRAFYDSDADGHGDIVGLTAKLDYLHALGVDCLWLLPIHPSPLRDDGYDVADYMGVHPTYGNLDAFKTFVNAVHERSMRVIMDFIPNHSSDQHEWFQMARRDPNSPYRDYYVWSDDPEKYKDARVIFIDTEKSNWTWDEVAGQYYWHRFFSSQPDLNFDNSKVREEMLNIMRHWLDIGIDGFRVDAVPYLFEEEGTNCENLARTHLFIKEMRTMVDTEYPGCILLAEACQMPAQVREYFGDGDEFHMGFHFPVMPRIFMSIRREDYTSLQKILEETPDIPPNCQWCTFLRNHDELTLEMVTNDERKWMWEKFAPEPRMRINLGIRRRLAPLLDNDRRQIELAYSLLFTMPGSPILYYGDEICMGDNIWLPDRNGVRTPMQWDDTRNAGFSTSSAIYTPVVRSEEYGPHRINVKLAQADPSSLFHAIRFMIAQRRKHSSFGFGTIRWVPCENLSIAVYIRSHTIDQVLVVSNLSSSSQTATINLKGALTDLEDTHTHIWVSDILTDHRFKISKHQTLHIILEPYQFLWLHVPLA